MSTVMTPEQFHTWSHHLQLTSETEALITAIRSSVCQFCHRLIWGHLRSDHRDGLAVWASGQGIHHCPHLACCSTPRQQHCRKTGLGMALPVSVLAANVPQLWVAYQEGNLADLSLGTWLLSMGDGLVWGIYSLIQQDTAIMVFACFQLTTSGLIVALKLVHTAKHAKQGLDP